jgi:hypothetical protein
MLGRMQEEEERNAEAERLVVAERIARYRRGEQQPQPPHA